MSTLDEIEQAVERLEPKDFARFASWIDARRHERWTAQMNEDAAGGKLDFLFEEAETEGRSGQLRDWPQEAK